MSRLADFLYVYGQFYSVLSLLLVCLSFAVIPVVGHIYFLVACGVVLAECILGGVVMLALITGYVG